MNNEKYTVADVAKMMGVSPATVSRVLNNRPGVSDELRQKILDAMKEIDYMPNTLARSFTMGSINIIALIFGDVRNPFYADLAFHIQKLLNDAGYMVMVFNSEYDTEKEVRFIKLASQFKFAGLMLITAQSETLEQTIQNEGMPTVLINRTLKGFEGDIVMTDNFQAGYIAAKHLMELGHQNAAFIFGNINSSALQQRYQGYRQVLENFQVASNEEFVFYGNLKMEGGYAIAQEYAQRLGELPTSVVASNDMMAIGFIDGLKKRGIQVPEQVSVIGFDNIALAGLHDINLTTIDQKSLEISKHAVQAILRRIEDHALPPVRTFIEPRLIVRGTTAACRQ